MNSMNNTRTAQEPLTKAREIQCLVVNPRESDWVGRLLLHTFDGLMSARNGELIDGYRHSVNTVEYGYLEVAEED